MPPYIVSMITWLLCAAGNATAQSLSIKDEKTDPMPAAAAAAATDDCSSVTDSASDCGEGSPPAKLARQLDFVAPVSSAETSSHEVTPMDTDCFKSKYVSPGWFHCVKIEMSELLLTWLFLCYCPLYHHHIMKVAVFLHDKSRHDPQICIDAWPQVFTRTDHWTKSIYMY